MSLLSFSRMRLGFMDMAIEIPQLLKAAYQIKPEDNICNSRGGVSKLVRPTFIIVGNNACMQQR